MDKMKKHQLIQSLRLNQLNQLLQVTHPEQTAEDEATCNITETESVETIPYEEVEPSEPIAEVEEIKLLELDQLKC